MMTFDVKKTKRYEQAMQNRDWQTCDLMFEEFNFLKDEIENLKDENEKLNNYIKSLEQVKKQTKYGTSYSF